MSSVAASGDLLLSAVGPPAVVVCFCIWELVGWGANVPQLPPVESLGPCLVLMSIHIFSSSCFGCLARGAAVAAASVYFRVVARRYAESSFHCCNYPKIYGRLGRESRDGGWAMDMRSQPPANTRRLTRRRLPQAESTSRSVATTRQYVDANPYARVLGAVLLGGSLPAVSHQPGVASPPD